MTAMAGSANSKLARYRQLMDAKRIHEESTTPSPTLETTARSVDAIAARIPTMTVSSQKSSAGAKSSKSWPMQEPPSRAASTSRGVTLNLNDELEQEHQQCIRKDTDASTTTTVKKHKENLHPNNFSAMKQIMKRKQMANAARKELDAGSVAASHEENKSEEIPVGGEEDGDEDGRISAATTMDNEAVNNSDSLSLDEKDASVWAMLGNHLNESSLDQEPSSDLAIELCSVLAITPAKWKNKMSYELSSDISGSGGDVASGISGVLSFLGESPLFDQTVTEENEAERNLSRSAEKVKKLEEHLLRSAEISPVKPSRVGEGVCDDGDDEEDVMTGREKGVTFAIQSGWATPRGNSDYSNYPKSPYVDEKSGLMMTPSKLSESMQPQANPMNESVIVSDGSDDEASGENVVGSPSPMKGIGDEDDASEEWDKEFGSHLESSGIENFDTMGSPKTRGSGKQRHRGGSKQTNTTPTRASLMERNHTLVREVRFADQTCVELSERKKYYKIQAGQFKKTLAEANKDNSLLRENYESSLQENVKLKVLVESLQAQKNQADLQVEAYRTQITDAEKTHRSSLKKMEKTYHSHLKNSEEQINSLNERMHQSLAANSNLQFKLDEVHSKWESKVESDATSKELISSLKERVASGDATASAANASLKAMQARIKDHQGTCDQHTNQLQRERNEREMIEHDRDDLQVQCDDLHKQLTEWVQTSDTLGEVFFNEDGSRNEDFVVEELKEYTPVKRRCFDSSGDSSKSSAHHPRTPTSNLLARTLRSELKRRQTVSEKLESAEHRVARLKDQLSDTKMDVEEAKADNALLEEDLEEKCIHIADLKEALEEKDDRIARFNEELEVLCQTGESEGASTASVESSSGAESSRSESERDKVSVLEERLDAVEETLEFTDGELVETKARLADTQELLDQTAGELERSEEELAEAQEQVADYEAQVDNLFKDLTEKEVEHLNISKFSDFQTSTLETMKEKLSQSDTVNAELRTQLNSCFQSLVALEKILRTYEDMDGLVGQKMTEQSRKIARLLETMEQFVQERGVSSSRDLESGVLTLLTNEEEQSIAESGSEELSHSTSSSSSMDARRSAWTAHYRQQLDQLREEVAAVDMERDDANKQLQKAHGFLQEFRDELSKQESEHIQETTSLKKQCKELEAKLSAVTSDLQTCKKENQSLSKTVATAENESWNEVSHQLSVIRSNNGELILENEKLRVDLQSFELQLEDEKALLRATREEANGYRQDVSNAKAAFECLTTECDLTKASLSKLEEEAQGLRGEVTQKEKGIKDWQESLSKAQTSFQEQNESLNSRCGDFEAKLSMEGKGRLSAEASLDDASKHIAMLEDAVKSKEEESQEKQNECQEVIIHLKQVQNALVEAEKEIAEAASTIEGLENQIQEKTSLLFAYEEAIIGYKDDIRRLNNELQTTVLEKNNRIQMLEQGLSTRQTLFTEQLDRTKEERDASTAELTEMIERLQNELQASNKSHQEFGERAKLAMNELEEEVLDQNEAQKDLEEEIIRKQARLEEETRKYEDACKGLDEAQNEIEQMTDRLNSLEMDCKRMATKHQDEAENLLEEKNRVEGEKNQLEEQMHLLQANIEDVEEIRVQQRHEIAGLSAQNASMQKKCNIFKDKVKSLNGKNKAWEDSYKAQSNDLVLHGMEISRLNGRVSDLKSQLIRQGSGRYVNRNELSAQSTPQGRTHYLGHPGTM